MARPIKPTPVLDPESSDKFLVKIAKSKRRSSGRVLTPKLNATLKRIIRDAKRSKQL